MGNRCGIMKLTLLWLALQCGVLGDLYEIARNNELRVGSFNVQVFGLTKLAKTYVMDNLCKIVSRYDIIHIMEIRDATETVIPSFLEKLNRDTSDDIMYDAVISERLGRTSSKEQYAYIFRTDRVEILDTYQYEDMEDVFEREPYGILVKSLFNNALPTFFLLGVHIHPGDTLSEMNFMDDVYRDAVKYFSISDAIIMGDMNADCSYLSQTEQASLDMARDDSFTWLINNHQDTTTKDTFCAYDRLILAGDLAKNVPRNKVDIFKYDQVYDLTYEDSTDVSDHYPLGLIIQDHPVSADDHVIEYVDEFVREIEKVQNHIGVAAFNVETFGKAKFALEEVTAVLSQIVRRYDIILIQEIKDASETILFKFLNQVNEDASEEGVTYKVVASERLGRTKSKEQYAFIYRTDKVQIAGTHQYDDSVMDVFEREPFSVLVKSKELDIPAVILIALHSKPSDVEKELNHMVEVYEDAVSHFKETSAIILGDMNADCSYLSRKRYNELKLVTDPHFSWLIDINEDTTTNKNTHCAYDRFIVTGPIAGYILPDSVGVFQYDLSYSMSDEAAKDVSDHYPVELLLQESCMSDACISSYSNKQEL